MTFTAWFASASRMQLASVDIDSLPVYDKKLRRDDHRMTLFKYTTRCIV